MTSPRLEISVIVPTRDRAPMLRRCLEGMARQDLDRGKFEVLVVDNGSRDETAQVVDELRSHAGLAFQLLHEPRPGLHRGRHCGMNAARTERLVFVDDDIIPEPSWLGAILEAFTSGGARLVGGRNLPDWGASPPTWLADVWQRTKQIDTLSVLDLGDALRPVDPQLVWGCNFAITRDVLEETKGFHPDAMPENLLQFRGDGESYVTRHVARKGYRTLYHPRATVHHFVPPQRMTVEYFQRRAFAQGVSESFTALRGAAAGEGTSVPPSGWKDFVARAIAPRPADFLLRTLLPRQMYLHVAIGAAVRRGYHWHQEQYRNDEALREWVMAADFLD